MHVLVIGRAIALALCAWVAFRAWRMRTAPRWWRLTALGACGVLIPALGTPRSQDAVQVIGYLVAVCGLAAFVHVAVEGPLERR